MPRSMVMSVTCMGGGGGLVTKSCLTLCEPMDFSLPGSSGHGLLQARILEWVAISFSRGWEVAAACISYNLC